MKPVDLDPRLAVDVRFMQMHSGSVPVVAGCYALADAYGEIVYIGKSQNLRQRFEQQLAHHGTRPKAGGAKVFSFSFMTCLLGEETRIEQHLLSTYKYKTGDLPEYNVAGP